MKRKLPLLLLLLFTVLPLSARGYIGLNQGLVGSAVEVGYMTRSFEQNLSLSLPLVHGNFTTPMASGNLVWRIQRFNPLVIGVGVGGRFSWGADDGYILAGGLLLSVSWETFGRGEVLFVEGSYMPVSIEGGSAIDALARHQIAQYLRIGYRHLF